MAKSFDINSTSYAGEAAAEFISPAILAADSIANNYVKLHENVKYKQVIQKLSGFNLQAAGCDFTADAGSLDLDEVVLTVTDLKVNEQFCKADFRQSWMAMQTGNGFVNDQMPPSFEAYLLLYMAGRVSENIEFNIWQGNYDSTDGGTDGTYTAFNSILSGIVAGTPGYESTAAGAFTADDNVTTGILTKLDDLMNNVPKAVLNAPGAGIFMSTRSLFLLQRAMAGLITTSGGVSPTFVGDPRPTTYLGVPIVTPAGFPDDTVVVSYADNFHFGTDLTSDFNQAVVVDMTQTDASDNVRLAMRFSGGTQIGHLGDVAVARRSS